MSRLIWSAIYFHLYLFLHISPPISQQSLQAPEAPLRSRGIPPSRPAQWSTGCAPAHEGRKRAPRAGRVQPEPLGLGPGPVLGHPSYRVVQRPSGNGIPFLSGPTTQDETEET